MSVWGGGGGGGGASIFPQSDFNGSHCIISDAIL